LFQRNPTALLPDAKGSEAESSGGDAAEVARVRVPHVGPISDDAGLRVDLLDEKKEGRPLDLIEQLIVAFRQIGRRRTTRCGRFGWALNSRQRKRESGPSHMPEERSPRQWRSGHPVMHILC